MTHGSWVSHGSGMTPGPAGGVAVFDVTAADALTCASRSYEVQQLAARVSQCADEADRVLAALARLELHTWQSPAGRAYRLALSLHAAALRRSRDSLLDAVAVVLRHARNVAQPKDRMGP